MSSNTHRKHYDYYMPLDADQMALIVEGLQVLRLYAQGFNDCDGRAKVTRIKKLENRIKRRLQEKQSMNDETQGRISYSGPERCWRHGSTSCDRCYIPTPRSNQRATRYEE